jgi:hypothetical protein
VSGDCYQEEFQIKQALYEIYLVLHKHRHIYKKPSHLISTYTEAFANRPWAWKVVGITHQALTLIAANNFEIPKKICRGHKFDRKITVMQMFNRDEPMGFTEFWTLAIEKDETVLMTSEENTKGNPFPTYFSFDAGDLFADGVSVTYRKAEKEFLRKMYSSILTQNGQVDECLNN